MLGPAAADRPEGQVQRVQQGVVPVEHRQALRLQIFKDLALGLQDTLPAAQVLDVGVADVGDDGDVRPHHLAQIADLSEVVHACFDHGRLVLRRKAQQRQRRADIVIEILRGLQDAVLRLQHGGDHLFGGGLAHAAGDLDHRDLEFVPVMRSQGPQGKARVVHFDVKLIRPQIYGQPGAKTSGRAGRERRVDKIMSVEFFSHPGQKQAPRRDVPAVGTHSVHQGRILPWVPPNAAYGGGDLLDRHRLHQYALLFS